MLPRVHLPRQKEDGCIIDARCIIDAPLVVPNVQLTRGRSALQIPAPLQNLLREPLQEEDGRVQDIQDHAQVHHGLTLFWLINHLQEL
eukprot:3804220-Amphidinium_carterae.2